MSKDHDRAHRSDPLRRDLNDEPRDPGGGDQGHPPDFQPSGWPKPGSGEQGHPPDFSQPDMPDVGAGDQGHPPAFHHQEQIDDENT